MALNELIDIYYTQAEYIDPFYDPFLSFLPFYIVFFLMGEVYTIGTKELVHITVLLIQSLAQNKISF